MKKVLKRILVGLFIVLFPFVVFYIFLIFNINRHITIEYGNILTWENILKKDFNINWQSKTDLATMTEVGDYKFKVSYLMFNYVVHLQIKDTTAPKVNVQNVVKYLDEELPTIDDFLVDIEDLSPYEIAPLNLEKRPGIQQVKIIVTDIYGNKTEQEATLNLIEYQSVPVFTGLEDLVIEYGDALNYRKNVSVYDKRYGDLNFEVDASQVNYTKSGTYTVIYSAIAPNGQKITAKRKVIIKEPPKTYKIENFPVFNQFPDYPNGCESIALYTLLKFYNINVTPNEIVDTLKKGSGPYWENETLYGGDPEVEFVGDPQDEHGYGVYQKPIIEVANKYKPGMIDYTGHALDDVLELVKTGIPVQVWVSINLQDTEKCASWINPQTGQKIDWICNLHSVVVIGYNNKNVIVSDPYKGEIVNYNLKQFEKMYNLFGKRAIYYAK